MKICANLLGGQWSVPANVEWMSVDSPYRGEAQAKVPLSRKPEVDEAIAKAKHVFPSWSHTPLKERSQCLFRLREIFLRERERLSDLISQESGKTRTEARAELDKGIEVMEFALSLQNLDVGGEMEVSRGVTCAYRREPLGVVCGITPFNFPAMVPLWMIPIALTLGNCFVLKPSEKVSQTPQEMGNFFLEAKYPAGVFSIVNGDRHTAELICEHPGVESIGFVGSSLAAKAVYQRATASGKRALCLGGAKNHMIILPDADREMTAKSVVDSFTGCAGQRCMAGSVLILVGKSESILDAIVKESEKRMLGRDIGCLIDRAARVRLQTEVSKVQGRGAKIILDGTKVTPPSGFENGVWFGPTILKVKEPQDVCAQEELFGPVLTVLQVGSLSEAIAIEHGSRYGNATSVFTASGQVAQQVAEEASSGMIGINVGIPVPREPFSFGGRKQSKFGQGDITGPASLALWSDLKKITSKWQDSTDRNWMS